MAADEIEKTCPECGKTFGVLYPDLWRYKRTKSPGGMQFYCSWKCYRAEEKREEDMGKLTQEQKNEVVEIAIQGGDPIEYLKKCGLNNPWASWDWIKKQLQKNEPVKYNDLLKAETLKNAGINPRAKLPPVIRHKEKITPEKPEAAMDINNLELQGGVNYQLKVDEAISADKIKKPGFKYEIKTIETEIGDFSYDRKDHVLIFRRRSEDEDVGWQYIKMTTRDWDKMLIILPQLADVMGVTL